MNFFSLSLSSDINHRQEDRDFPNNLVSWVENRIALPSRNYQNCSIIDENYWSSRCTYLPGVTKIWTKKKKNITLCSSINKVNTLIRTCFHDLSNKRNQTDIFDFHLHSHIERKYRLLYTKDLRNRKEIEILFSSNCFFFHRSLLTLIVNLFQIPFVRKIHTGRRNVRLVEKRFVGGHTFLSKNAHIKL